MRWILLRTAKAREAQGPERSSSRAATSDQTARKKGFRAELDPMARVGLTQPASLWLDSYLKNNPDDPQEIDLRQLLEVLNA